MANFTKAVRKRIVEEFASRNGGVFDAAKFLEEVKTTGPSHEAFEWFTWNDDKAAHEFRLNQARAFVRDLRIKVEFSVPGPGRSISVRTVEAPLALSLMENRANGGGYHVIDPTSPEAQRALCREAAGAFKALFKRYELAIAIAEIPAAVPLDIVGRLDAAGEVQPLSVQGKASAS